LIQVTRIRRRGGVLITHSDDLFRAPAERDRDVIARAVMTL